jgi:hypothetical protein
MNKEFKNRFGIFMRKNKRPFDNFLLIRTCDYISGHKGIAIFIGNYLINIIYKF